jgi:hypothetical protein
MQKIAALLLIAAVAFLSARPSSAFDSSGFSTNSISIADPDATDARNGFEFFSNDFEDLEDLEKDESDGSDDETDDDDAELEALDGRGVGPKLSVIFQHPSLNPDPSQPFRLCSNSEINALQGVKPERCLVCHDLENLQTYMRAAFIKKLFRKIKSGFQKIGRGIKKVAQKIGRGIKTAVKKIGNGLKKVGRALKKGFQKFATFMKKYGHHFAWLAVVVPGVGKIAAAKLIAAKIAAKVGAKIALKKVAAKAAAKFLPKVAMKAKGFKVGKAIKAVKAAKSKVAKVVNKVKNSKASQLFKKLKNVHDKIKNRGQREESSNSEDQQFADSVERYAEKDEAQDEARDIKVLSDDANRLGTSNDPNTAYDNLKSDFQRLEHSASPGQFRQKYNADFRHLQRVTESRAALEDDDARLDRRVRNTRRVAMQQRQWKRQRRSTSQDKTPNRIVVVPIVININQKDLERISNQDIEQDLEETRGDSFDENDLEEEEEGPEALENSVEELEEFLKSDL